MGTMLDQIAQRVVEMEGKTWTGLNAEEREGARHYVRAILKPLSYPDEAMIAAGAGVAANAQLAGAKAQNTFVAMMKTITG
jgi:hypothetical protein